MTAGRDYLTSLETLGIKLGLDQIRGLLAALGHPDRAFHSILIAGTNGKGSVTAMTERGLRAAGHRTARYTSPHLVDLEERFSIGGTPIDAHALDRLACRVRDAAAALPAPPSFFEATTALGLEAFREAGVDVAVLEVGLGGRLDATNAVTPIAEAITAIDFNHEAYLGHTIEAIAAEKAGIIKAGVPVVLAPNPPAADAVVAGACRAAGAALVRAREGVTATMHLDAGRTHGVIRTPRATYGPSTLALRGRHQIDNAIVAIRLLETIDGLLPPRRLAVPEAAIQTAIEDVSWPARLEHRTFAGHEIIIDGAHNPAGAAALASYLDEVVGYRVPIVVGVMADKSVGAILGALAPRASHFVCTAPDSPRAATPADLVAHAAVVAPAVPAMAVMPPIAALRQAQTLGSPVVVAGSLYLAGEVRARII